MATLNYAENFQQALVQPFKKGSHYDYLFTSPLASSISFIGAKLVKIPSILVGGYVDADRDNVSGDSSRKVDNNYEVKQLTHYREFDSTVDPMDIDETNMALSMANISRVLITEQKIPERDCLVSARLYAFANANSNVDTTPVTKDNIIAIVEDMIAKMEEGEAMLEGAKLHLTVTMNTLLKQAAGDSRRYATDTTNLTRTINYFDGIEIVKMPSSRMKSSYDFTVGFVPAVGAKQINIALVSPQAFIGKQKYEYVGIDTIKGRPHLIDRNYADAFGIDNRAVGVQINAAA